MDEETDAGRRRLHIRGDAGTAVRWLEANLQFVASEMASGEPGFETIVSRLADILFASRRNVT